MGSSMLWFCIVMGCLGVFFLAGWLFRRDPPLESLFLRLLQWENRSARTDTRVMLHELHRKVEDLSAKMQRMDAEMQDLLAAKREKTPEKTDAPPSISRSGEIYKLTEEGFSAEEIARRLNMGRGEVELILSLAKKPFWVVERRPDL